MPKPGTIVLIPFPFTNLSGAKVRPALVITSEGLGDDVIVIFISSLKFKGSSFDVIVLPTKLNGLKIKSKIKCTKIATLEKKIILGELGRLEDKDFLKVKMNLKKIFKII